MTPAPQQTSRRKVLIVDPDLRTAHELAAAVRQMGYLALEASTFPDGKRLWNSELPDVLVADVRLGQFNGLQLLVRAKLERPEVTGIITCSMPDVVLEAETRRFGGIFVLKPLDTAQIVQLIQEHTAQQALIRNQKPTDRRIGDRRKIPIDGFEPERRASDRRDGHAKVDRRTGERRQLDVPSFSLNRRVADRRTRGRPS